MAAGSLMDRLPGRPVAAALLVAARRRMGEEFAGTPPHRWLLSQGRPDGLAAMPQDLRPADLSAGRQILAGAFLLAGETLAPGPKGDPWNRPSPSRRFAVALHRFGWMRDLLATGHEGAAEGLRLTLEWSRTFGRWNGFAWSAEVLERRVFNLACAIRTLSARASDAEAARLALDLARQARVLLQFDLGPTGAAERAAAGALAGAALAGRAGDRLLAGGLKRLCQALPQTVMSDGGPAARSPQAALELYFDLVTLDEALTQRGLAPPEELARALDRLGAAVRFFTLGDGRLAAFHGGEELERAYVAAARAQDEFGERPTPHALGGYQRLDGRSLQVLADAAPPPAGPWSVAACAQPLAIEVLANGRRLIVGGGWSPDAQAPQAMRLVDAASTVSIGDAACGEPLRGFAARVLGPQLAGPVREVEARRHESPGALWLELAHDGWIERYGLRHERRLYLDLEADELRGEDRFTPVGRKVAAGGRRFASFMVRFHLHPDVQAQIARDRKSVLLRTDGADRGWWLRNDAVEVALEPSVHYRLGQPRRTQQIVLRGQVRIADGARLRWKLSAAARAEAPQGDGPRVEGPRVDWPPAAA
jgi:uncharacterized heparinase superfamily protein